MLNLFKAPSRGKVSVNAELNNILNQYKLSHSSEILHTIPITLSFSFFFLLETKARAMIESSIIKFMHENNQYY